MEIMRFEKQSEPSFPIQCARCGHADTVPFMPTDERLVYCRECFRKIKEQRHQVKLEHESRLTSNELSSYHANAREA